MDTFIIGVLTSLVAAALYTAIVNYAWPTFQDRALYKGIRIAGTWNIVEQRNGMRTKVGQIQLKQTGRRVFGASVRSKRRDGKKSDRNFRYTGKIDGNQVTLLFEDSIGVGFDAGSYIFIVQNDGLTMNGMATFHGKPENQIVSEPRTLEKAPS